MKKVLPYLLGAANIGGGAFLYFRNKKKGDVDPIPEPEPAGGEPKKVVVDKPAPVIPDPWNDKLFVAAVRKIQEYLGVGIDGNPGKTDGSNTNKALSGKFPAQYRELKNLSPGNFTKWVKVVSDAKSGQYLKESAPGRQTFGNKLFQLGVGGKRVFLNQSQMPLTVFRFDSARNQYVSTGKKFTLTNSGHLFARFTRKGYDNDGFFILAFKNNPKEFLLVNPYTLTTD